jgi:hypothetical protein
MLFNEPVNFCFELVDMIESHETLHHKTHV